MTDRISPSIHYRSSVWNSVFANELAALTREERIYLAWRIHKLQANRPGEGSIVNVSKPDPLITPLMKHLAAIIVVTFLAVIVFDHMSVGYSLAIGLLSGFLVGHFSKGKEG